MKRKLLVTAVAVALVLVCVFAFAACTPSLEDLKATYRDAGYTCLNIDVAAIADYLKDAGADIEGDPAIEYAFTATKLIDTVVIVAYSDSSVAKDVYESLGGSDASNVKKKGNAIAFSIGESEGLNLF